MKLQENEMSKGQLKSQVFSCGCCKKQPVQPVVTECGHIFCWKCLSISQTNSNQCPICQYKIQIPKLYPIFIQHQQQKVLRHPDRPAAKNREKIINPGVGNSNLPVGLTHLQSNIENRRQTPGPSYFPSMITNNFNRINCPKSTDKDHQIFQICRKGAMILGILLVVAVAAVIFL